MIFQVPFLVNQNRLKNLVLMRNKQLGFSNSAQEFFNDKASYERTKRTQNMSLV